MTKIDIQVMYWIYIQVGISFLVISGKLQNLKYFQKFWSNTWTTVNLYSWIYRKICLYMSLSLFIVETLCCLSSKCSMNSSSISTDPLDSYVCQVMLWNIVGIDTKVISLIYNQFLPIRESKIRTEFEHAGASFELIGMRPCQFKNLIVSLI